MSLIHVLAALRFYIKGYSLEETSFSSVGEHTAFLFGEAISIASDDTATSRPCGSFI